MALALGSTRFLFFSERDAFDTLFDHAPDKLNVVKKVGKRCLRGRAGGRKGSEMSKYIRKTHPQQLASFLKLVSCPDDHEHRAFLLDIHFTCLILAGCLI